MPVSLWQTRNSQSLDWLYSRKIWKKKCNDSLSYSLRLCHFGVVYLYVLNLVMKNTFPSFHQDPFVACAVSKDFIDRWRQFLR